MVTLLPMTATGLTVRRRGKTILGPLDLTLGPGGPTMLIGPNGSGKTTLLKTLHGIERPTAGRVSWSMPIRDARHRQAFVFQRPIMLRRTVGENLAYPLRLRGEPDRARVLAWAARIGLGEAIDQPAARLSGGEQQKLALGRALITEPDMLFLDEPTANLDGRATREIEALLSECHARGTRILMATHDFGQLRRLAGELIFLRAGRIWETTTDPDAPSTPELARFLKGDIVE